MGVRKVRISELPEIEDFTGFSALGVDAGGESARAPLGFLQDVSEEASKMPGYVASAQSAAQSAASSASAAYESAQQAAALVLPQFDLLTTKESSYSGYDNTRCYDRTLFIRFTGTSAYDWGPLKMYLYMYRNKGNKTFKKVYECGFSDMEYHAGNSAYQTHKFPISLCRILWERFDFMQPTGSQDFHNRGYDSILCLARVAKLFEVNTETVNDYQKNQVKARTTGRILFSGTFGLRVANEAKQMYGEMKTFKVAVINVSDGNSQRLHFIIKMHNGVTTMP